MLGRKKKFSVNRNGELIQFKLPTPYLSLAKAPCGPSTDELRVPTYQAMSDKAPNKLLTWMERRLNGLGWTVLFTPPYMCNF